MSSLRRSRIKLLLLMALFAAPMLSAWAMVTWRVGIPEARTAHGQLAPEVPALDAWPLAGDVSASERWVLAFDCRVDCADQADRWWRLHRALGREAPRVERLRVIDGGGGAEPAALPGERVARWRSAPSWGEPGALWLLSPEGEVVLGYAAGVAMRDVMDDLQHLLKVNPERGEASN
ncbi:hypothetical protein [Halomonas salifodinae]|uniref:hypothetical protein n=1 Tax=Halomonas salifodinae TaxID=438745 RepID=UPI0033A77E3F